METAYIILIYFVIGFISGAIITRVERDSHLGVFVFLFWPVLLPTLIIDKIFTWIADL